MSFDPILARRSIRKFTDEAVSDEMIEKLVEAADAAPSACNKRPLEFFVITNKEMLDHVSSCGRFTRFKSPLIIVVVGNLSRALPMGFSEYWIHDAGAACENILVKATALGLGACWCGIHPQKRVMEKVSEALGLSEKQIPFGMIKIGHPAENPEPHSGYEEKRVHFIR